MSGIKQFGTKLGGLLACRGICHLMSTLDYQALFYDPSVDPVHPEFRGPAIFVFWHEYIPVPFYLRPHCDFAMLVSRHRDANLLSEAARHMGHETVRGSTKRGGETALRELFRRGRTMNLVITPDGPRGPRRRLASGCIYLASRMQVPLIPFGMGYSHFWRMPTWDRFAVPWPYCRARSVVGPKLWIAADTDRDGIETERKRVERILNRLTQEAEQWASSGQRRVGQVGVISRPPPRRSLRDAQKDGSANLAAYWGDDEREASSTVDSLDHVA